MPHINTEPGQHDLTASAYIVRLDTPEPSLLLHMYKKLRKLLQFGGHVEPDENPWEAITHEVLEESGYEMSQLQLLQPRVRVSKMSGVILHPVPVSLLTHKFEGLDHYHTDIAFAFTTEENPNQEIGNGESSDIRMFTAQQLKNLSTNDIPENTRQIGLFVLGECVNWTYAKSLHSQTRQKSYQAIFLLSK